MRSNGGGSSSSPVALITPISALSSIGSFFGLGGVRANGGPVAAGTAYLVGERGPELFVPGSSGTVVPNDALGGKAMQITYAPQIHIDSRSDLAQVAQSVSQAVAQGNQQLLELLHARGAI